MTKVAIGKSSSTHLWFKCGDRENVVGHHWSRVCVWRHLCSSFCFVYFFVAWKHYFVLLKQSWLKINELKRNNCVIVKLTVGNNFMTKQMNNKIWFVSYKTVLILNVEEPWLYSVRRLRGSLWTNMKVITISKWNWSRSNPTK